MSFTLAVDGSARYAMSYTARFFQLVTCPCLPSWQSADKRSEVLDSRADILNAGVLRLRDAQAYPTAYLALGGWFTGTTFGTSRFTDLLDG